MPKKYIVVRIRYYDPIIKRDFDDQAFVMNWDGVQNGVTHPDFTHARESERKKINNYLKNRES